MKKIALVGLASAFAIAALVGSHASANEPVHVGRGEVAVNPGIIPIFINWSWVKGTIHVPGPQTGNLAGMACHDLSVTAASEETLPRPPGYTGFWFNPPKWSHTAIATGNWASGSCNYAIIVPPNMNFSVTVNGAVNQLKCNVITPTVNPPQAGWFKVPVGATKVQDFQVSSLWCQILQ